MFVAFTLPQTMLEHVSLREIPRTIRLVRLDEYLA